MNRLQRISALLLAVLLLSLSACTLSPVIRHESEQTSGDGEEERQPRLVLNITEATLAAGEHLLLVPTVIPVQKYAPVYHFETSDSLVAQVDEKGLVTATGAGVCTVTASVGDLTGTCTLTVTGEAPVTTTAPTPDTPTVVPTSSETAPTPTVPTTEPPPTPTPTVTTTVTETETPDPYIPIERLELITPTVYMGGSFRLSAVAYPENATETYSFYVSDTRFVDLNTETGEFSVSKNDGVEVTFFVRGDDNGVEASKRVGLSTPAKLMRLDDNTELRVNNRKVRYDIEVGKTWTLKASFRSGDETQTVRWINDSTLGTASCLSVSSDGQKCTVTAVKPGEAALRLNFILAGEVYDRTLYLRIVEAPKPQLEVDPPELTLTPGEEYTLKTVKRNTSGDLIFESGDKSVLTVDSAGKIAAIAPGLAIVTVSTADRSVSVTCRVTVKGLPEVVLEQNSLSLSEGEEASVGASLVNAEGTLNYVSDNDAVASVTKEGLVTARAAGIAVITVSDPVSGASASLTVTVAAPDPTPTPTPTPTETPAEIPEPDRDAA